MPQFFITSQNIDNNTITVTDKSDINHIINVLRVREGDKLILASPEGICYKTQIKRIEPDQILTEIIEKNISSKKLNIRITLAQSILKGPKQDFVIQKATELGVTKIIPFISKNTVVKIETQKDKIQKQQRWQKIAQEASKQSERSDIPDISHIININELIELNDFDVKFICAERDAEYTIKTFLKNNEDKNHKKILMILGPEGGWDQSEIKKFKEKGINSVSLGPMILRAETAAITAITDVIYEYEL